MLLLEMAKAGCGRDHWADTCPQEESDNLNVVAAVQGSRE